MDADEIQVPRLGIRGLVRIIILTIRHSVQQFHIFKEQATSAVVKKCLVKVDGMIWPTDTPVPFVSMLIQTDHPVQPTECGCLYTLDGKLIKGCKECLRLQREKHALWNAMMKQFGGNVPGSKHQLSREYMLAEGALRKHYWSVVVWEKEEKD